VTIENGVNLDKYRARPGVARDPRRIISFGRFARHKRADRVIALLSALRKREPGWTLVLAGAPGDHVEAELRAAAMAESVGDAVRIMAAPDDTALGEEVARASWFCSASAYEGFGIAAVEAAGAGLVPVLSDIPPFARLQAQLGAGLLFDPADVSDAADRMIGLMAKPGAIGTDATDRLAGAIQHHGWARAATAYSGVYRAAFQRPPVLQSAASSCG
jgi:alpha-1,3-mannosyltransferase